MSLAEAIDIEIAEDRLPHHWTTADLLNNRSLMQRYAESALRTDPPNRSVDLTGVGRNGFNANAANPVYIRVGLRGRAILYSRPNDLGVVNDGANVPAANAVSLPSMLDDAPVEVIVEDESEQPANINGMQPLSLDAIEAIRVVVEEMHGEYPWDARLESYRWKRLNFFETQEKLADLIWRGSVFSRLILENNCWTVRDQEQVVNWAEDIFDWGGTRQRRPVTWEKVRNTLENALRNQIVHVTAPMNSGYTKVASFGTAFLEEGDWQATPQVINDSRVAASLTSRLDAILVNRHWNPRIIFPGLGTVNAARGGTRPRQLVLDWPSSYQNWQGQFAATMVITAIRDHLNQDGNYPQMPCADGTQMPWSIRGVEAVLFMDGY